MLVYNAYYITKAHKQCLQLYVFQQHTHTFIRPSMSMPEWTHISPVVHVPELLLAYSVSQAVFEPALVLQFGQFVLQGIVTVAAYAAQIFYCIATASSSGASVVRMKIIGNICISRLIVTVVVVLTIT